MCPFVIGIPAVSLPVCTMLPPYQVGGIVVDGMCFLVQCENTYISTSLKRPYLSSFWKLQTSADVFDGPHVKEKGVINKTTSYCLQVDDIKSGFIYPFTDHEKGIISNTYDVV